MMNRVEAFKELAKHVTNEIVVSSYSSASDWIEIVDRPLNYFSFGVMGGGSSHGLGLALARPERRVIVLEGDGSLLMNLGTLVTIAAAAPKNLIFMVCQNGTYEANGGHPIVNQQVDFIGIARSAGIKTCVSFSDVPAFAKAVPGLLKEDGPVFVLLDIEQGPLSARSYDEMYRPARRVAFREALGQPA